MEKTTVRKKYTDTDVQAVLISESDREIVIEVDGVRETMDLLGEGTEAKVWCSGETYKTGYVLIR